MSLEGFDQDSLYQVSGTAKADNIGLFFTDTSGAPNLTKLTGVSDRSITITDLSQLNKISNNLVLRLDKDFSGEINLDAYMTVTENNRLHHLAMLLNLMLLLLLIHLF